MVAANRAAPPSNPGEPRVLGFGGAPTGGGGGGNGAPPSDVTINGGGAGGPGSGGVAPAPAASIRDFDQPGYRWVPVRNLATDIRTAAGPQMGNSPDGHAKISMGSHGVSQVLFSPDMSDSQRAVQLMAAGYANYFTSDPVAFDAARQSSIDAGGGKPQGLGQNIAAGMLGYAGKNFSQTAMAKQQFQQTMYEQAAQGAQAYVEKRPGNAYTSYLEGRLGPMSDDDQAWGVHMMTDRSSPESGWSTTLAPATNSLVSSGIAINAVNRASASNSAVFQTHPANRPSMIRATAAYGGALVAQQMEPGHHPLEADAAAGRIIPAISKGEVEAATAIFNSQPTIEQGVEAAKDIGRVQGLANMVIQERAKGNNVSANDLVRGQSNVSYARSQMSAGGGGGRGQQTVDVISGDTGYAPQMMGGMSSMPAPPAFGGGRGSDAVIDTNYRDAAGGGGGNVNMGNVGSTTAYIPGVGQIGSTTMRAGGGYSGVARQTVNASMDVVANLAGGSVPIPPMNPNMVNPGSIRQVADVVFNQNAVNVQGGGGNENINMSIPGQANLGPIEQNISSRGGRPADGIMRTSMNVNAEILPPSYSGGGGTPSIPSLGSMSDAPHIRQQMNIDVNSSTSAPHLSDTVSSINHSISADATHGAVDVNVSGGGNTGANTFTNTGYGEVFVNQQASFGNQAAYMAQNVASAGMAAANNYSSSANVDTALTIQLMDSGFSNDMLSNQSVASFAVQVQAQAPKMLSSAAVAAKVLQPGELNMNSVQAVHQLVEVQRFEPRQISRQDILNQISGIPKETRGGGGGRF